MMYLLALLALAGAADAPGASRAVVISDAHTRPVAPGQTNGAAYFTLRNTDTVPHTVVSASAPVATAVELHDVVPDGELMAMVRVASVEIPAGGQVRFEPGHHHVMLIGIHDVLPGEFPLALTFEDGTRLTVAMVVR